MMRVVLIAIAVCAGGAAAWLALGVAAKSPAPEVTASVVVQPTIEMDEILVAATSIPKGGKIEATDLKWQSWPADAVPEGFIARSAAPDAVGEIEGYVARNEILPGEAVMRAQLAEGGTGFMSAILDPGTRAIAVRVSAATAAGGFVLPEDYVDVLHSTSCEPGEGCIGGSRTRTILRNVKVLAIDQQGRQDGAEPAVLGETATLALTPSQAELIVGAETSGRLSLALRPVTEIAAPAPAVAAPAPVQKEPEPITVRVRRAGSAIETVTFQ